MADIKTLAASRGTLVNFDPRKLKIKPGLNARDFTDPETIAHVETICASIMARGYLNSRPMEIFQEGADVFVGDGECRLRACMLAIERGVEPVKPAKVEVSTFYRMHEYEGIVREVAKFYADLPEDCEGTLFDVAMPVKTIRKAHLLIVSDENEVKAP